MKLRNSPALRILISTTLALAAAASLAARPARIKLATLAPKGTSFHLILQEMGAQWKKGPQDGAALTIFTDGTMGGESDMVRRMRLGQLQAGLLTISGITDIDNAVSGLQNIPMAFRSLDEAAYVRDKLAPKYEKQIADKGFIVLGWFDSGWVHAFSREAMRVPEDLKGEKVFVVPGSQTTAEVMRSFGMQPVILEPTDVLVSLQTGLITVVPAPPFYALAGQFFQPAPHMLEVNWAPLAGALLVTKKAFEEIPPAMQQFMRETGAKACAKITESARNEMRESIAAMEKRGLVVQHLDGELQQQWVDFAESLQSEFRGKVVPEDEFDAIMKLRAEFRSR
ncbi:MAG: TRAP transporter substrate-binding protein DctP [Opitutaceae bacterium]